MNAKEILKQLEFRGNELKNSIKEFNRIQKELSKAKEEIKSLEEAKIFLIELGNKTQKEIKEYIENTVTMAIHSVFDDEYTKFHIHFESKRDQSEVYFFLEKNKVLLEIKEDTESGGVADVVAFALRIVQWSLENPRTLPIIILDEPFKHVSVTNMPKVFEMVKELSAFLNIQVIIVTHHSDELFTGVDNQIIL